MSTAPRSDILSVLLSAPPVEQAAPVPVDVLIEIGITIALHLGLALAVTATLGLFDVL